MPNAAADATVAAVSFWDSQLFGILVGAGLTLLANFLFEAWRNRQADRRETLARIQESNLEAVQGALALRDAAAALVVATQVWRESGRNAEPAYIAAMNSFNDAVAAIGRHIYTASSLGVWEVWAILWALRSATRSRIASLMDEDTGQGDELALLMGGMLDALADAIRLTNVNLRKRPKDRLFGVHAQHLLDHATGAAEEFAGGKRGTTLAF